MQANIEDVITKTKDVAQSVGKKGSQYFEASKKKLELIDAKSKLGKAYEKFGKLQFDSLNGEAVDDDEYDCAVADIKTFILKVEELEAQFEEAKAAAETEELKRGAEELKNGVVNVSKEVVNQAKAVIKSVHKSVSEDGAESDSAELVEAEPVDVNKAV